jgi:hypothetical protein
VPERRLVGTTSWQKPPCKCAVLALPLNCSECTAVFPRCGLKNRFVVQNVCVYPTNRRCLLCSHDKSEITTLNCRSRPALLYVLRHADTLELFVRFCTSQHSEENVLFWMAVRDFKALPAFDSASLQTTAAAIVNKVCGCFGAFCLFLALFGVSSSIVHCSLYSFVL